MPSLLDSPVLRLIDAAGYAMVPKAAARAMLSALKEIRANAGEYQRGQLWQVTHDAVTAAEAAGLKEGL